MGGERVEGEEREILFWLVFILIILARNKIVKGDFYVVAHKGKSKDHLSNVKNSNISDKCGYWGDDE